MHCTPLVLYLTTVSGNPDAIVISSVSVSDFEFEDDELDNDTDGEFDNDGSGNDSNYDAR